MSTHSEIWNTFCWFWKWKWMSNKKRFFGEIESCFRRVKYHLFIPQHTKKAFIRMWKDQYNRSRIYPPSVTSTPEWRDLKVTFFLTQILFSFYYIQSSPKLYLKNKNNTYKRSCTGVLYLCSTWHLNASFYSAGCSKSPQNK